MYLARTFLSFFSLLLVVSIFTGCASSGHKIDPNNVEKIEIGVTTKEQMYSMFGPPLSQSFSNDGKLSMIWFYVHVGPFGSNMKQQNLAVLFDQNGTVEKYNIVDNTDNGARLGY